MCIFVYILRVIWRDKYHVGFFFSLKDLEIEQIIDEITLWNGIIISGMAYTHVMYATETWITW